MRWDSDNQIDLMGWDSDKIGREDVMKLDFNKNGYGIHMKSDELKLGMENW